jgi:hypothetical protein
MTVSPRRKLGPRNNIPVAYHSKGPELQQESPTFDSLQFETFLFPFT